MVIKCATIQTKGNITRQRFRSLLRHNPYLSLPIVYNQTRYVLSVKVTMGKCRSYKMNALCMENSKCKSVRMINWRQDFLKNHLVWVWAILKCNFRYQNIYQTELTSEKIAWIRILFQKNIRFFPLSICTNEVIPEFIWWF